jgi:hypothetical protein
MPLVAPTDTGVTDAFGQNRIIGLYASRPIYGLPLRLALRDDALLLSGLICSIRL